MAKKNNTPKVKTVAAPKAKIEASPKKVQADVTVTTKAAEAPVEEIKQQEKAVKEPAIKTRFQVGDVIKHEHRLYQCISVNGHHDAILAAYSHQNNRADHSKVRTVSNDPSINDGFVFSKY